MIEWVCGACEVYAPVLKAGDKAKSPGMMYKHYSPRCQTFLFAISEFANAKSRIDEELCSRHRVAVLCERSLVKEFENLGAQVLDLGGTPVEMATNLYRLLREAEKVADTLVAIEPSVQGGVMDGVMNRLKKACLSTDIPRKA
jgi:hypothetical protein